jgi:hypothetical protein
MYRFLLYFTLTSTKMNKLNFIISKSLCHLMLDAYIIHKLFKGKVIFEILFKKKRKKSIYPKLKMILF